MPSINVQAIAPPVQAPTAARAAAPRDADGDNDGSRAPVAQLAPAGQPGSVLHAVA
jgi:hypothetical protein